MARPVAIFLLIAWLLGFSAAACSDDSRPLYVDITENASPGQTAIGGTKQWTYEASVRIPPTLPVANEFTLELPATCERVFMAQERARLGGVEKHGRYLCSAALSGQTVRLHYSLYNPSVSTLMKFDPQNGPEHTVVLGPNQLSWKIPRLETRSRIAVEYMRLGVYHIFAGRDHLLFLICLLWIAGSLRRVLTTVTGFTLAHSATLGLSAFNVIRVPIAPVEAGIALSIVFLAAEIIRQRKESLTWRYPIAVSSTFGLLHGLGFAAALNEIGLPQNEMVTGILFFNIGVEIGQVFIAGGVMLFFSTLKHISARWVDGGRVISLTQKCLTYGIGSVSCYWLLERCMAFAG